MSVRLTEAIVSMASTLFRNLVQQLAKNLKSRNHEEIPYLLNTYCSVEQDWTHFAQEHSDLDTKYTRNNLFSLPDNLGQVLLLTWKPNSGSKVHNHPQSECWVKLLGGQMEEKVYDASQKKIGMRRILRDEVTHINDSMGMHSMHNRSLKNYAFSLHVYHQSRSVNIGLDSGILCTESHHASQRGSPVTHLDFQQELFSE